MAAILEMTAQAVTDLAKDGWVSVGELWKRAGRDKATTLTPAGDGRIRSIDDLQPIWRVETELTWLVPDFLVEGSVNYVAAETGTGKSWLSLYLAGAVAHGRDVFGKPAKTRKVLYVDGENPAYTVKGRLNYLGIPETDNLKVWGGWQSEAPPRPDHPLVQKFAEAEKPLLIWDSLVEFHTGEEQSATDTRRYMKQYRKLANLGATVFLLHHTGKAESAQEFRGSSDIKAAVDMSFLLTRPDKKTNRPIEVLKLEPKKSRLAQLQPRFIRLVEGVGFELSDVAPPDDGEVDDVAVVREIVIGQPGQNQSAITKLATARDIARNRVPEILKRQDLFRMERGRGHEHRYFPAEDVAAVPTETPAAVEAPIEAQEQAG
jgi:hypothetical protein